VDGSRFATEQTRMPASWLKKHEKEQREALMQTDQGTEFLLMGLRLVEGINLTRLNQLSCQQLNSAKVSRLQDLGMIKLYNGNISVTNQGFIILNAVLRELIVP
jgi:coproporphyrinogen III oxidase-like Fe-S oxidoreductase